jgi:hypothetical protein
MKRRSLLIAVAAAAALCAVASAVAWGQPGTQASDNSGLIPTCHKAGTLSEETLRLPTPAAISHLLYGFFHRGDGASAVGTCAEHNPAVRISPPLNPSWGVYVCPDSSHSPGDTQILPIKLGLTRILESALDIGNGDAYQLGRCLPLPPPSPPDFTPPPPPG